MNGELAQHIEKEVVDEILSEPQDVHAGFLTKMYDMQAALDGRIISERAVKRDMSEWVIGLTIAMESEIDEIRREVNWKWWKNPKEIDKAALQGEVIDLWHFLLSLSREVGLEPADIYRLYVEKNAENHARQSGKSDKDGYAAEESSGFVADAIRRSYE